MNSKEAKLEPEISTLDEDQLWNSYNNLLLAPEVGRIRKLLARYELFKQTVEVPGDIFEMGVFKGVGVMFWLKLLTIYDANSNKRVVGFDTFSGFKQDSLLDYERESASKYSAESGFSGFDSQSFLKSVQHLGTKHAVELVDGDVTATVSEYLEKRPGLRISLLHLDLDTYNGTKSTLEACWPRLSRGAVIVFDEYGKIGWGESDAVDEFFAHRKAQVKIVPFAESPAAYLIVE